MVSSDSLVGEPSETDDRALELIERAWKRTLDADALRVDVSLLMDIRAEGMRQEFESTYQVRLQRPNKFALLGRQGQFADTLVSDGEKAIHFFPMFGKYMEWEAPETIDQFLTDNGGVAAMSQARQFLAPVFSSDAYEEGRKMMRVVKYVGQEETGEGVTHHLEVSTGFDSDEIAEELPPGTELPSVLGYQMKVDLLEAGEEDLRIDRIFIDMGEMIRAMADAAGEDDTGMAEMYRDMEMEYTLRFTNWEFPEEIASEEFAFTPPDDADQADTPEDFFSMDHGEEDPHALLGEKAPDFELELLDGERARLADHLGEKVIVLDFWATWCGPCVQAMPILIEVTDKYRDQDVVFWAVNQAESPDTIRKFIKKQEWDLEVPLDSTGEVGRKYDVSGIPQTVLIGADGTVQAVHVGFSPDLRETLPRELDALLAGERLSETSESDGEEPGE